MTAAQENAIHAAQIQHDTMRRNQLAGRSPMVLPDVAAADIARLAGGETIEISPEDKLASGSIPGTAGLKIGHGRFVPTGFIPQPTRVG